MIVRDLYATLIEAWLHLTTLMDRWLNCSLKQRQAWISSCEAVNTPISGSDGAATSQALERIMQAIRALKNPKGSSLNAIFKSIASTCPTDKESVARSIARACSMGMIKKEKRSYKIVDQGPELP